MTPHLTRRTILYLAPLSFLLGRVDFWAPRVFMLIDRFGLPPRAWQLIHKMEGVQFTRYREATSRATGFLGWIENRHEVVVGWVDRGGVIYRNVWTLAGRGYNVARDGGIRMIRIGQIVAKDFT